MYEERRIVNLSLTPPSREMKQQGVFELPTNKRYRLKQLLEFGEEAPTTEEIQGKAESISELAEHVGVTMALVEAPIFMNSAIEKELRKKGIEPVYPYGYVKRYKNSADSDELPNTRCRFFLTGLVNPPEEKDG